MGDWLGYLAIAVGVNAVWFCVYTLWCRASAKRKKSPNQGGAR
jgi:hypothetical protein